MTEYTQEEAIFRMNEMGKAGRPFLFIIDYKRERIYVESPEEIAPSELLYDLNGFTNINHECNLRDSSHLISGEPVEWQPSYVSFEEYVHSFETVSRHIHAGNSYLVNLTCATPVYTNLSLKDIFTIPRRCISFGCRIVSWYSRPRYSCGRGMVSSIRIL